MHYNDIPRYPIWLIPVRVRPGSRAQSSVISLDLVLVLPIFPLIDIKCQVLSYFLSNISNADTVLINWYLTSRSERAIYNTMMPS